MTGGSDREICLQKIIVTIFSQCLDGPKLGTRHGAALAYAGTLQWDENQKFPQSTNINNLSYNLFRDKSWLLVGSWHVMQLYKLLLSSNPIAAELF